MSARLLVVGILAVILLYQATGTAQGDKKDELLAKATLYVAQFVDQFSNVVAEETLVQETTVPRRKRTMKSDYLLVRYPEDVQWHSFRDVSEVDGKPVRDQQERLTKLFLEPSESALRRARDLADAGARYNLLNIGTINNPLLVMAFLQEGYRERFRFNLAGLEKKLGPTVRQVQFQEWKIPSLIKGNSNADILSRGLVWIEEDTGRVVKTELQLGARTASMIRVTTLYKFDEELGINVPIEMRDWYPDGTGEIRGVATYGRFRRFQVKTDEELKN
jgi:hypothetical protein